MATSRISPTGCLQSRVPALRNGGDVLVPEVDWGGGDSNLISTFNESVQTMKERQKKRGRSKTKNGETAPIEERAKRKGPHSTPTHMYSNRSPPLPLAISAEDASCLGTMLITANTRHQQTGPGLQPVGQPISAPANATTSTPNGVTSPAVTTHPETVPYSTASCGSALSSNSTPSQSSSTNGVGTVSSLELDELLQSSSTEVSMEAVEQMSHISHHRKTVQMLGQEFSKWGNMSTRAPVLYAVDKLSNDLRSKASSDVGRTIIQKWRELPADLKASYLLQAKKNKQQRSVSKTLPATPHATVGTDLPATATSNAPVIFTPHADTSTSAAVTPSTHSDAGGTGYRGDWDISLMTPSPHLSYEESDKITIEVNREIENLMETLSMPPPQTCPTGTSTCPLPQKQPLASNVATSTAWFHGSAPSPNLSDGLSPASTSCQEHSQRSFSSTSGRLTYSSQTPSAHSPSTPVSSSSPSSSPWPIQFLPPPDLSGFLKGAATPPQLPQELNHTAPVQGVTRVKSPSLLTAISTSSSVVPNLQSTTVASPPAPKLNKEWSPIAPTTTIATSPWCPKTMSSQQNQLDLSLCSASLPLWSNASAHPPTASSALPSKMASPAMVSPATLAGGLSRPVLTSATVSPATLAGGLSRPVLTYPSLSLPNVQTMISEPSSPSIPPPSTCQMPKDHLLMKLRASLKDIPLANRNAALELLSAILPSLISPRQPDIEGFPHIPSSISAASLVASRSSLSSSPSLPGSSLSSSPSLSVSSSPSLSSSSSVISTSLSSAASYLHSQTSTVLTTIPSPVGGQSSLHGGPNVALNTSTYGTAGAQTSPDNVAAGISPRFSSEAAPISSVGAPVQPNSVPSAALSTAHTIITRVLTAGSSAGKVATSTPLASVLPTWTELPSRPDEFPVLRDRLQSHVSTPIQTTAGYSSDSTDATRSQVASRAGCNMESRPVTSSPLVNTMVPVSRDSAILGSGFIVTAESRPRASLASYGSATPRGSESEGAATSRSMSTKISAPGSTQVSASGSTPVSGGVSSAPYTESANVSVDHKREVLRYVQALNMNRTPKPIGESAAPPDILEDFKSPFLKDVSAPPGPKEDLWSPGYWGDLKSPSSRPEPLKSVVPMASNAPSHGEQHLRLQSPPSGPYVASGSPPVVAGSSPAAVLSPSLVSLSPRHCHNPMPLGVACSDAPVPAVHGKRRASASFEPLPMVTKWSRGEPENGCRTSLGEVASPSSLEWPPGGQVLDLSHLSVSEMEHLYKENVEVLARQKFLTKAIEMQLYKAKHGRELYKRQLKHLVQPEITPDNDPIGLLSDSNCSPPAVSLSSGNRKPLLLRPEEDLYAMYCKAK